MPMTAHELQGRAAWKANHYDEMADAARTNADNAARAGESASVVASLRGMQQALEMAARDFHFLAES